MNLKGWQLMGLASIFSFFGWCGAAAMSKDAKQVTNFKWCALAEVFRYSKAKIIT